MTTTTKALTISSTTLTIDRIKPVGTIAVQPSRLWTLTADDGAGRMIVTAAGRASLTSRQILRATDGSFVIAWTDQNGLDGNLDGVFARVFDANGVTSGPDLQLDVKATGNQVLTSIAAGGRAVAVWVNDDTRIAARLLVSH